MCFGARTVIIRRWDRFDSRACSWRSWCLFQGAGRVLGSRNARRYGRILRSVAQSLTRATQVDTALARRVSDAGDAAGVHGRGEHVGCVGVDMGSRGASLVSGCAVNLWLGIFFLVSNVWEVVV